MKDTKGDSLGSNESHTYSGPVSTDLDQRIELAVAWTTRNLTEADDVEAGWGWVPDVPPNPQNTAEVVCALLSLGQPIPSVDRVERLVRCEVISSARSGDWAFRALIDVAWRLRALRALGAGREDPDVRACIESLLAAQEPETGGWRLAGRRGPVSVTASVAAVGAMIDLVDDEREVACVRRGTRMLIASVFDGDRRADPIYASAQVAALLADPTMSEFGGVRTDRAREDAVARVMAALRSRSTGIEEEVFRRGSVTDTWRHMTLPMCLRAVATAKPESIFDPAFRAGMVSLIDLQELGQENVNSGGFRTSREGFVTSYATTQALEVFAAVRDAVAERVNPARTFDMLCRVDGAHHSDPQELLRVGSTRLLMNSSAGLVFLVGMVLAGLSTALLGLAFADDLGRAGGRAVVVWGHALMALGATAYLVVRFPQKPSRALALAVFTAFTALVLPVVTFLVS